MAKPTETNSVSPLEKWRRWKDKVFEADSVESEEPPAEPVPVLKETPRYQQAPQKVYGSSGGPDLVPIKAPPPKGEPTMMPIQAPPPKGEPTMMPIQAPPPKGEPTMMPIQAPRSRGEPTMVPIQAPPPKGEATMFSGESRQRHSAEPTMMPGQETAGKGEATMVPGESRQRHSAEPTMTPGQETAGKGEATMVSGESRDGPSAEPTMMPGQEATGKGEATMVPGESRQRHSAEPTMMPGQEATGKGEATMVPGESRDGPSAEPTMMPGQEATGKGEATMMPIQALPPKGEATMMPIQAPPPKGEATMMPIQAPPPKGEATMMPIQAPPPKGEPTMMLIDNRRGSAEPTMVPIHAPPPKGEATMIEFIHSRTRTAPFRSRQYPKGIGPGAAPTLEAPDSSHDQERDKRAISTASVENVIYELRSAALQQGLDFSIIQPDSMKIDFFTDSRALRVNFTGSEIAIDRIVVREVLTPPDTQGQSAGGNQAGPLQGFGSARERLLEQEQEGFDARKENTKVRIATFRDKKFGALDWKDVDTPEKAAPEGRVAIEASYFDADDGRTWLIEMINGSPAPDDEQASASGGELTPKAAKSLVMLLLDILRSITGPKSSL